MSQVTPCKPYFDSILLFCLLKELTVLEGKKLKAVKRDGTNTILLCFDKEMLLVSTNPVLYRTHLIHGTTPKDMGKHPFEEHLKFLRVAEVKQLGLDRIFALGFSKSGIKPSHYLICELIGPSSNVFLIDNRSIIISSHRSSKNRKKGETFQQGGTPFNVLSHASAEGMLNDIFAERDPEETIKNQFKKPPVWLDRVMSSIEEGQLRKQLEPFLSQPEPYLNYEGDKPCFISPLKISSRSRACDSFSAAITELYHHFLLENARDRIKREILKKLKNLRKIQKKVADDQKTADLSGEFKKKGELILLHIKKISKGARMLTVPDPYEEESMITISLDPAKSPSRNAAEYFRKARKAEKSKESIRKRTDEIAQEITRLAELIDSLDELPEETIDQMVEDTFKKPSGKDREVSRPFREFRTRSGRRVLVGRSSKENENLTFHIAKPGDLFFHVREAPGSHTILVTDGNVTKSDIQDAAEIAAHFSKAKHAAIVPVSYTQRRYVRKSRKLGLGKVVISHEKTVFVEPTPPPKENTKSKGKS